MTSEDKKVAELIDSILAVNKLFFDEIPFDRISGGKLRYDKKPEPKDE
jgi:hypothetical protein